MRPQIARIRQYSRPECGRIITVGSCIATRVGFPGMADYAATKAAIVGYSKGVASDLAPSNITVNVMQPGAIDTDMNPADSDFAPTINFVTASGGTASRRRSPRPSHSWQVQALRTSRARC